MSDLPVLHQFRFSMYPEKVRWALDYKGMAHRRVDHLPGPHAIGVRRVSGQQQVPVLALGDEVIAGSAAILERLERLCPEPALFPADPAMRQQALDVQAEFDLLGPKTRCAFFGAFLADRAYAARVFADGAPPRAAAWYRRLFPVTGHIVALANGVRGTAAADNTAVTEQLLDDVARRTADTGYLVGDGFTVADLTAAVVLMVTCLPPETPHRCPEPLPPALAAWFDRWADHPGTAWVRTMYARHRPASVALAA